MEVNHFPSAHICRTELTSPAVKSLMTLQCCGPHSARPASPNQCLHSNSQHVRRQVRRFRSCATKQPLQTSITNVHSARHTDSQALRSVGIYLCPPGPGPAHMYPLLASEAALIYKICLNLFLARAVCSSAKPYHIINQPQSPYSWALLVGHAGKESFGQWAPSVLSSLYPVLKLSSQFRIYQKQCIVDVSSLTRINQKRQVHAVTKTCFLCCSGVTWPSIQTFTPLSYLKTKSTVLGGSTPNLF